MVRGKERPGCGSQTTEFTGCNTVNSMNMSEYIDYLQWLGIVQLEQKRCHAIQHRHKNSSNFHRVNQTCAPQLYPALRASAAEVEDLIGSL